ncbi:hypothetical protein M514_01491 [Trichuris suis]|uniref:G-protein coupled receptors family 1 profile domain-containing protein n=1 Tax=Trichuris suis TaxID=68888 RepID=A0A085NIA1_9BILA|nr:hypothetical protein M514_01491 [Trichuris suis]
MISLLKFMEFAEPPPFNWKTFFRYVKVVLAVLAIITNGALLAVMIRRKPKRYFISLMTGYCIAMICISIGVVLCQPLRLYEPFKPENSTTPLKCAVVFWHIHFYAVGEPLLALSTFMIAFGNFLTIHGRNFKVQLGAHYVRSCFIIQASVVLVNLTLNWTQIFLRSDVPINTRCFQKEIVDYKYNVVVFTTLALCGYLTVLTEVVTLLLLRLNKSSYSAIRLVQIRREVAVMKQTIVLVTFVFIAQTIPNTYKFIDNLGYHNVFWDRFVSIGTSVEAFDQWVNQQVLDPLLEEAVLEGVPSEPEEVLASYDYARISLSPYGRSSFGHDPPFSAVLPNNGDKAEMQQADVPITFVVIFSCQLISGVIAALFNLLIFCVIIKVKYYRSDYIMVAALAISNVIVCVGFIASGSFRLKQMFKPAYNELMTPQLCFRSSVHVLFWDYGNKLSSTLILLIAAERCITMLRKRPKPSGYNNYILVIVLLIFLLNSICHAANILASFWGNRKHIVVSKYCLHEHVIPESCYFFEKFYILIVDTTSVIVYFSAIGCLRRQRSDCPSIRMVQQAREKVINQKFKSLMFCQLILNVIPVMTLIILKMGRRSGLVTDIIWLMQPTNCTVQVVLIACNSVQLRNAMKRIGVKIIKGLACGSSKSGLKNVTLVQSVAAPTIV